MIGLNSSFSQIFSLFIIFSQSGRQPQHGGGGGGGGDRHGTQTKD